MELTKMESEVIKKIVELEMGLETYDIIDFSSITVEKREFTEVGQYTYLINEILLFESDEISSRVFGESVGIKVPDMENCIDFLLYVSNQGFELLECHTYGEVYPVKINDYTMVIHR